MPTKQDFIEQGRKRFKLGGDRPADGKHWSSAAMQEGWDDAKKCAETQEEPQPVSITGLTSPTGRMVSPQPSLQQVPASAEAIQVIRTWSGAPGGGKSILSATGKLGVVPIRQPLGLLSWVNTAFIPRPVICHLDQLSYRHQFAKLQKDADRYKRSSHRVLDRWNKKIEAAKVRQGLSA
jgi:hypothetical protein